MAKIEEHILVHIHEDALNNEGLRIKFSTDITNLWRVKGWDDNQLLNYIFQRFERPLELLSLAELNVTKDEIVLLIKSNY